MSPQLIAAILVRLVAALTLRDQDCLVTGNLKLAETVLSSYGAGTLMTVFTIVTDALNASSLPSTVLIAAFPAVETEIPA